MKKVKKKRLSQSLYMRTKRKEKNTTKSCSDKKLYNTLNR